MKWLKLNLIASFAKYSPLPEHEAIGVTCAAAVGHPPVVGESEPMGDLVTKAVVTQGTALPHSPDGVA